MTKKLKVGPALEGQRLDVFATTLLNPASRSFAKDLVEHKQILVNGKSAKPSHKLKSGEQITIKQTKATPPAEITLPVIYEDNDVLVLDKPAGLLTHSKGAFNPEPTVATFIASKIKDLTGERAGIVHRLDRSTSGVIICAKNPTTQLYLQKQFSSRRVVKRYLAILEGSLEPAAALIDMPIARHPKKPQLFRVDPNGKSAQTKYKVRKIFEKDGLKYSFVEFEPLTGRTHQLRVHSARLGHSIVGDTLYGGPPAERLMLHAANLQITLPSDQPAEFSAKLPPAFKKFMD